MVLVLVIGLAFLLDVTKLWCSPLFQNHSIYAQIMIYTIIDNIYFDDDKKIIFSDEHQEELSATVVNLLVMFLENSNQLIKREDLLLKVWEENNLIPSDSNLNKNISLIRKSLTSFGIHGMIETVPKQGFIFHSHTKHSKLTTEKVNGELILRFLLQRRMVVFLFVSAIFLLGGGHSQMCSKIVVI